ncbi:WD40 repeat domain-containing protein [Nocardia sp. 2YAB30]|uniref:WD40 repeat domain-containing protein n=1 Tax=unclassified Nocardia TaxID=2637762 RepID=UPI003F94901B
MRGHEGGIWSLAVSPDGRWVLSGSADGTIRYGIWRMAVSAASCGGTTARPGRSR